MAMAASSQPRPQSQVGQVANGVGQQVDTDAQRTKFFDRFKDKCFDAGAVQA